MLLAFGIAAAQAPNNDAAKGEGVRTIRFAKGRVLIQPRAGLADKELDKILKPHGGRRGERIEGINVHVIELPPAAIELIVAKSLRDHPHIKFAEVDEIVDPDMTLNDPNVSVSWHLSKINAPTAWDYAYGSGVTVAVLDTGVDSAHPDLLGRLVPGWNFVENNTNVADLNGHGTATSGVAVASGNNSVGGAGIGWGSKLMPVRIADASGSSSFSRIAQGITWAADHGAKVASISFRNLGNSSTVISAAQYLRSKGGVVVVSAGNDGTLQSTPQSSYLTTVGATDSNDARASFSNFGPFLDVVAPGVSVRTTLRGGGYGIGTGTSFATPVVAGTYALMMSANPALSPSTLDNILMTTVRDLGSAGYDNYFGHGRVNASAAVSKARSTSAGDSQAPAVIISTPSASSKVSGLIAVNVSASDNVGVTKVQFYAGATLVATDTTSPYAFSWDTTTFPDGALTLQARAYDSAGNVGLGVVSVTVGNDTVSPTTAISNPTSGTKVTGTVGITVNASDNKKVARISLLIDGKEVAVSYGTTLSYPWNVPSAVSKKSSGTSTITARAYDSSNNMGSSSITVYK